MGRGVGGLTEGVSLFEGRWICSVVCTAQLVGWQDGVELVPPPNLSIASSTSFILSVPCAI